MSAVDDISSLTIPIEAMCDVGFKYVPSTAGSSVRFDPPDPRDMVSSPFMGELSILTRLSNFSPSHSTSVSAMTCLSASYVA